MARHKIPIHAEQDKHAQDVTIATQSCQVWLPVEIQHRILSEVVTSALHQEASKNPNGEPDYVAFAGGTHTFDFDASLTKRVEAAIGPLAHFAHLIDEGKRLVLLEMPVEAKVGEGYWTQGASFDIHTLIRLNNPEPQTLHLIQHLRVDIRAKYPGHMIKTFELFAESLGKSIEQLQDTKHFPKLISLWVSVPAGRLGSRYESQDWVDQHFLVDQLVRSMRRLNLKKARVLVGVTCEGLESAWDTSMKEDNCGSIADWVGGMSKMGDVAVWI